MKQLEFKNDVYNFNELWRFKNSNKNLFQSGDVIDLETGEIFDISKLYEYRSRYMEDILEELKDIDDKTLSIKQKLTRQIKLDKIKRLELLFENNTISYEQLKHLIKLKYNSRDLSLAMRYNRFAYLNLDNSNNNLSDGDIGKLYKIVKNMSHKANTLLKTENIQSNPLNVDDLSKIFNTTNSNTYKFLKRIKKENIVKTFKIDSKEYISFNPKYIINGVLNPLSYLLFKEDINSTFPNIPKEVLKLWEYEFINSTIEIS